MITSTLAHISENHVKPDSIDQLALDELQSLIQSKDALDQDYPQSAKNISHNDLWKLARRRVIRRLSSPEPLWLN